MMILDDCSAPHCQQEVENRSECEELCESHHLAFMFFRAEQRTEDSTNCYCLISDDLASQHRDLSFSVYPSDITASLCTEGREISTTKLALFLSNIFLTVNQ